MKKFLKFVTGVAAVAGAACGVVYCSQVLSFSAANVLKLCHTP